MIPHRLAYRNLFAKTSWLLLLALLCLTGRSYGQTYGFFEYSVSGTNVAITKYNGFGGEVAIPSEVPGVGIVTTLKYSAFYRYFGSFRVTIPSGITDIEPGAFVTCSGLTAIAVDAQNSFYSSLGGVLFNKNQSILIQCPQKISGAYTIPSGVTSIENSAFAYCGGLTSVTAPPNLTSIGSLAFYGCSGLTNFTLPDSVTAIGNSAFAYCRGLASVTIPSSVTNLESEAFAYCIGLTAITVDAQNSFYSSLNGVLFDKSQSTLIQCPCKISGAYTIPSSVTSIGNAAFSLCTNLTSVTTPNSLTSIGDSAFVYCGGLTNVTLSTGVTSIWNAAFANCTGLTSITLPSGVTSIGDSVFNNCTGLTNINLPNTLTSIGNSVFYFCTGLTSITIPDSLTSVGDSVFYYCTGLTNINLPSSVASIGDSAFASCSGLTSISLPTGVTTIENYAFLECGGLTNVTLPSGVTTIGNGAFSHCMNLASVTLPNSVTTIGDEAFTSTGLTRFTFPPGVTNIGNHVLAYCGDLTNVIIPSGVISLGDYAFVDCGKLASASFQGDAPLSFGARVFADAGTNFSIYYPATASGWTTPTWRGYPAYPYPPSAPAPVASLALSAGMVTPSFSNLQIGTTYQLRAAAELNTWTNSGAPFTATNASQACPQSFDVKTGGQLFFRLQSVP